MFIFNCKKCDAVFIYRNLGVGGMKNTPIKFTFNRCVKLFSEFLPLYILNDISRDKMFLILEKSWKIFLATKNTPVKSWRVLCKVSLYIVMGIKCMKLFLLLKKIIGGGSYYNNKNVSLLYIIGNFCKITHYNATSENQKT